MKNKLNLLDQKQKKLSSLRPLPKSMIRQLDQWLDVELTYTSNAIEGNTLTRSETALILEKGLTVKGKSLNEHLEARNHKDALDYLRELVGLKYTDISQDNILKIHQLILDKIDTTNAGIYRDTSVRITGSAYIFPGPGKVSVLMTQFMHDFHTKWKIHPVLLAARVHFELVHIHPFVDGNGRTARLLMNLILMQAGFPVAIIGKKDRSEYIDALEIAHTENNIDVFNEFIIKSVEKSFVQYYQIIEGFEEDESYQSKKLSQESGVSIHTIRFYLKEGLISPISQTESGYHLYNIDTLKRVKLIRKLQEDDRLTLKEIKKRLK